MVAGLPSRFKRDRRTVGKKKSLCWLLLSQPWLVETNAGPKYHGCLKDRTSSGLMELPLTPTRTGKEGEWGTCSPPALPFLLLRVLQAMGSAKRPLEWPARCLGGHKSQTRMETEPVLFSFCFKPETRILRDLIHGM